MDEAGDIVLVETPLRFEDGDPLQIFAQVSGGRVRFFDDGSIVWHFLGRGLNLSDDRRSAFMRKIAAAHGTYVSDDLDFELHGEFAQAPRLFAKFLELCFAFVAWEREHIDADVEAASLLDEVAALLTRESPNLELRRDVPMRGVSKQQHKVDFVIGNEVVFAIKPRPNSVSAAIRKILDVKNDLANEGLTYRVVIDDRLNPEAAFEEGSIVSAVARVSTVRSLEAAAARMH